MTPEPTPRLVYRNGSSPFWSSFAAGLFVGGGAGWIQFHNTGSIGAALSYGAPVALGLTAAAFLFGLISAHKTVATLFTDGVRLTGRRQGPVLAGPAFSFPIAETTDWRWYDDHRRRFRVSVVFEFRHRDRFYRMPCIWARRVDIDGLRELAPAVVSHAVMADPLLLPGIGARR